VGINPENEGFFVLLRREEKWMKNPPILVEQKNK
jgi:hypothetical protein